MLASPTIVKAGKEIVSCSLNSLIIEYGHPESSLDGLRQILSALEYYEIELDPPFETGDLDFKRALKPKKKESELVISAQEMLEAGGENHGTELKSSITIDTKRLQHDPGREIKEYVSDQLKLKLAQEICAFLNRDGGKIFLGIANDLEIIGCENDFEAFPSDGTPEDKTDLIIQSIVSKYFVKPTAVLAHLQSHCFSFQGKLLVLIDIAAMSQLAFLKKDCGSSSQLYVRIGTSAQPIKFEELEDYFDLNFKN